MGTTTILYLLGGTVAMIAVMLILRKTYSLPIWKGILSSVLLTVIGVIGVKLMYFIENGSFDGLSFFGAVFFIPPFAYPISVLLRLKYTDYLDITAPSVAIMLSVMKINCLVSGCCYGRVLYQTETGVVRFPSQIFEMVCAAVICLIIVFFIKKGRLSRIAYPFFMFVYGLTRFVLNLFRETNDFWLGLGIGNIWAVVSIIVGIIWIFLASRKTTEKE